MSFRITTFISAVQTQYLATRSAVNNTIYISCYGLDGLTGSVTELRVILKQ
jgi:hypothetical protein